ncbi:MAG: hypothetical protein Terrestrivirus6_66 [Terrestrivirus sp.]|uniref:Uncharacterized protein n=1 Tax=Terrestrivirus sp. TaxID=2487775 RepID=A0A3G4ZNG6_9VIRU|nr:MAG: hypothetical protein Terrestrivirus6_66 [Terrestrivirus sp.]
MVELTTPLVYIIALVLTMTIYRVIGQSSLKQFVGNQHSYHYLLISFLAYYIISLLLSYMYNFENVGIVNNLWAAFSIVAFTSLGYFIWNETVTIKNIIGIFIILIGIGLLLFDIYVNHDQ